MSQRTQAPLEAGRSKEAGSLRTAKEMPFEFSPSETVLQ